MTQFEQMMEELKKIREAVELLVVLFRETLITCPDCNSIFWTQAAYVDHECSERELLTPDMITAKTLAILERNLREMDKL